MKDRIYQFLHDARAEFALMGLIVLSVVLLIVEVWLEQAPEPSPLLPPIALAGYILTGIFILELMLRFWVARNKKRFFRNYWIDILAVIPTLRAFRVLRVLRLLRVFRMGVLLNRRLAAVSQTMAAGLSAQLGILLMIGTIVLSGALAIMLAEPQNFSDLGKALWWSFATMVSGEPASFSDQVPSLSGQIITAGVMLGGLTMFAVFTGVVSAVMVQQLKSGMEARELSLDELRDHIVICGWNRAGHVIIAELRSSPQHKARAIAVVAEDLATPEEDLELVDRTNIYLHKGDYTRMSVLEEAGIAHADQAILMADKSLPRSDQDRDARTVLAALTIEKMNPKIHTTAQLLDRQNNVQLQSAGVENVVVDDEVCGHLIATSVRNKGVLGILSELLSVQVGNQLYKVPIPDSWSKSSYGEIFQRLKREQDVLLVGLERGHGSEHQSLVNPKNDTPLQQDGGLVIIAPTRPKLE